MSYKNFYEFEEYYSMLFSEKKYDEALSLLHHANELLPKDEYEKSIFELMICEIMIYSQTNNIEDCPRVIKNSFEKGYSLPLHRSYFDFIREHHEFEVISDLNRKCLQQAKENSKFKYEVHLPQFYEPAKNIHYSFACMVMDMIVILEIVAGIGSLMCFWKKGT